MPETPIWLLSKNRPVDAMKSLQWLRGWVSSQDVWTEYSILAQYNELSNSCANCRKQKMKCSHPAPTICDKLKDITRKRTLKPFIMITILYFLMEFSGMFVMRPYLVQILNAYGIPVRTNLITVYLGLIGVVSNICLLFIVKLLGKRRIYLISMIGTILSCFGLCEL